MKFFFRITDLNKVGEKSDIFSEDNALELIVKPPVRTPRTNGDKARLSRRKESAGKTTKNGRANKKTSQDKICDKIKQEPSSEVDERTRMEKHPNTANKKEAAGETNDSSSINKEANNQGENCDIISDVKREQVTNMSDVLASKDVSQLKNSRKNKLVDQKLPEIFNDGSTDTNSASITRQCNDIENKENKTEQRGIHSNATPEISSTKPVITINGETTPKNNSDCSPVQNDNQNESNSVYTNITLKRTNNVEIITKIQKVSNREGQPIGLNIIKQTVKKNNNSKSSQNATKQSNISSSNKTHPKSNSIGNSSILQSSLQNGNSIKDSEEEKRLFLQTFELKANNEVDSAFPQRKDKESIKKVVIQKRKNSSPIKHEKLKRPKVDKKPTKRIIIQCKQPAANFNIVPTANSIQNTGLQTLIENCKIPSSLSITIKDTSDNGKQSTLPPVKNFIEILKLSDENVPNMSNSTKEISSITTKVEFPLKLCDNDSEQKVDQDLAEIARSLTEKIPMSTTISQIIGPKQQFPIPTKPNVSHKPNILPSPVPELTSKLLTIPKEAKKLAPRSPQTFQRIFEESIKKPDVKVVEKDGQKSVLDLGNEIATSSGNNGKRNILEIATQLYKKTKMEQEKIEFEPSTPSTPVAKIAIPRLPQKHLKPPQKNLKFEIAEAMKYPQTVTNLHSNALGMNYTVSVGPNTNGATTANGTVTNIVKDSSTETVVQPQPAITICTTDKKTTLSPNPFIVPKELPSSSPRPSPLPRNRSPSLGYNSPRHSPKHSPKSSPVVKHMYAPTPNLLMDPLRVNTFTHKLPSPKLGDMSKPNSPSSLLPMNSPTKLSPKVSSKLVSPSLSPKTSSNQPSRSNQQNIKESPSNLSSPNSGTVMTPAKSNITSPNQMTPSQILEKYNIQNLAQLTASFNFNATNFALNPGNQLAALQHAMFLKNFEIQNRQNWVNMNQGSLLQYEKYLQSLKANQTNHLLGNIKEN